MDMFFQDDDMSVNMEEELPYARRSSLTYEEIAKDLVFEEVQYMRELNMIIKVFRAAFVKLFRGSKVNIRDERFQFRVILISFIPSKPLHNRDIVSIHSNHFSCMGI